MARGRKGGRAARRGGARRLFARRTGHAVWSRGQRRLACGCGAALLLAALLYGGWRGTRRYLLGSGLFPLRRVTIQAGDTMSAAAIRQYLGIREGMPLFALDISRAQAELLRDAPAVQSLTILRRLPDGIVVRVVERQPLARLANRRLAVDAAGVVFPCNRGIELLPSISGLDQEAATPGARLAGMAAAAIELLQAIREAELPLSVVDIEVGHEDYICCTFADQRHAKLAWEGMGSATAGSRRRLLAQLSSLTEAMGSARGRALVDWDATIPGRIYAR